MHGCLQELEHEVRECLLSTGLETIGLHHLFMHPFGKVDMWTT
jgi:hypothetical protein